MDEITIVRVHPLSLMPLRMNKASVVISVNGDEYFVTRRIYNIMLKSRQINNMFLIEKEYKGIKTNWLALPSIF